MKRWFLLRLGPMRRYTGIENHIDSAASEILRFKQTDKHTNIAFTKRWFLWRLDPIRSCILKENLIDLDALVQTNRQTSCYFYIRIILFLWLLLLVCYENNRGADITFPTHKYVFTNQQILIFLFNLVPAI